MLFLAVQNLQILCIYNLLATASTTSIPYQKASFSVSSIIDPVLHPIVVAGSNRCEAVKSFFGLSYEQMQHKNATNFNEFLKIAHITKKGNIKYNMNETNIFKRLVNSATSIVFLIHGFMESSDGLMVQGAAPEFLKKKYVQVFALDGSKLINLEYMRSSTYVRFMGEGLGAYLSDIVNNGVNVSKISLVGHSLGAHIAGIAGKQVYEKTGKLLSRITGLDPAGPCFSNVNIDSKLDKTDAEYVDVIHTNGGMLGLKEPVGHKDFYPNNGMSQPGCFLSTCDHSRAWEMFSESINSPDNFPARKCENWTMFQNGNCKKNEVTYLGIKSNDGGLGNYYLTTGSSPPYGLGPTGSG
ncbi:unnamed protein product, partial [Brenthis ino]